MVSRGEQCFRCLDCGDGASFFYAFFSSLINRAPYGQSTNDATLVEILSSFFLYDKARANQDAF